MSPLFICAPASVEPMSGHAQVPATGTPRFLQPFDNQWLCQQALEQEYEAQKVKSVQGVDPIAERAVTEMGLSRFQFMKPAPLDRYPSPACKKSESLFSAGAPSEDLSFCLRNFLAVDPVEDPNAVHARIAVREGRVTPGNAPLSDGANGGAVTGPLQSEPYTTKWLCQQALEREYNALRLKSARMVDPVAGRAVAEMDLSQFLFAGSTPETFGLSPSPTHNVGGSLFGVGAPPEDLNFGLKSFLAVDPVGGPDALYARIAVKEGRATPGYVPFLPPLVVKEEGSCKAYMGLG